MNAGRNSRIIQRDIKESNLPRITPNNSRPASRSQRQSLQSRNPNVNQKLRMITQQQEGKKVTLGRTKRQKTQKDESMNKCNGSLPKLKKDLTPIQKTVGLLTWTDTTHRKPIKGHGVLISKNLMLTTASNIYSRRNKSQNQDFKFQINQNFYDIQTWSYPKQFETSQQASQFDYALVKLKNNLQNPIKLNRFPVLHISCTKCLKNMELKMDIFDFSKDEKKGKISIVSSDSPEIEYDILTSGKPGYPIIVNQNIFAIHLKSDKQSQKGLGRLITPDMANNIKLFGRELDNYKVIVTGEQHNEKRFGRHSIQRSENRLYRRNIVQQWKNYLVKIRQRLTFFSQIDNSQPLSQLKFIDFTSRDDQKLMPESIKQFTKISLNNLQDLKLDDNRIGDKGLKILCQKDYPKLKKVELNNNSITINGLRYIYFNKWRDNVEYKLYSVESNHGGYHLNVDKNIPLIKSFVNNQNMSNNLVVRSIEQKRVQAAMKLLLQTPFQGEDQDKLEQQSRKLQQEYKEISEKDKISLAAILLYIKRQLQDNLLFVMESSLKTNVTSKILFSGYLNQRIGFEYNMSKIAKVDPNYFRNNFLGMKKFQTQFLMRVSTYYQTDPQEISVDSVEENPPRLRGSVNLLFARNNQNFSQSANVKYMNYFSRNFRICKKEFDSTGDLQFPQVSNASVQERGGFPYYQPVVGKRFGIKVKNVFEDDKWLSMDNSKGQYAVGFHGVKFPKEGDKLSKIMLGRKNGEMLKGGKFGQAYQESKSINENQPINFGIYFSPYFLSSLFDYGHITQQQQYHIVLQCRLKPEAIKITTRPEYWVVNQSLNARPYGIIVFTKDQVKQLKKIDQSQKSEIIHKKIYNKQFTQTTWNNQYKHQYTKFISQ